MILTADEIKAILALLANAKLSRSKRQSFEKLMRELLPEAERTGTITDSLSPDVQLVVGRFKDRHTDLMTNVADRGIDALMSISEDEWLALGGGDDDTAT